MQGIGEIVAARMLAALVNGNVRELAFSAGVGVVSADPTPADVLRFICATRLDPWLLLGGLQNAPRRVDKFTHVHTHRRCDHHEL